MNLGGDTNLSFAESGLGSSLRSGFYHTTGLGLYSLTNLGSGLGSDSALYGAIISVLELGLGLGVAKKGFGSCGNTRKGLEATMEGSRGLYVGVGLRSRAVLYDRMGRGTRTKASS